MTGSPTPFLGRSRYLEDLSETENFAQPPSSDLEESLFVRSDEEFDVIPEATPNKKKRCEAKPFHLEELIHDIRGGSRVWDHTHPPIYTTLNLGSGGARELGTDSGFSEVLVNDLQAPRRTRKRVGLPVSGSFVVANGVQTGAIIFTTMCTEATGALENTATTCASVADPCQTGEQCRDLTSVIDEEARVG
jgi:hypothetical protein